MRQIVPWFLRFSLIFFCMRELRRGEHELQSDEKEKPLPDSCLPLREKKKKKRKKQEKPRESYANPESFIGETCTGIKNT